MTLFVAVVAALIVGAVIGAAVIGAAGARRHHKADRTIHRLSVHLAKRGVSPGMLRDFKERDPREWL